MKKVQDVITADDFASSKVKGEMRFKNEKQEKEKRKIKPNSMKNPRKRALEELRLQELEGEDDDY